MSEKSLEKQGNYEVGYGKPPVRSRFEKGKSGNPAGFPKGQQKMKYVLLEMLAMSVEEFESFEPRTGVEMMAKRIVDISIHGDDSEAGRAMKFITDRTEGRVRRKR
jgi:hypothetical protein